jgi:hypothetical protein
MKNIVEVYCLIDNFVKKIQAIEGKKKVGRKSVLTESDFITLAVIRQNYGIKTIKQFYDFVKDRMQSEFPQIPSYQQFNSGMINAFPYVCSIVWILSKINKNRTTNYHIVDSTPLPVCNNQRRFAAKIFRGAASSGKNLDGWFWGFKLHLIINDNMQIESIRITGGSTSDINALDEAFTKKISGFLVGDKGYLSKKKAATLAKRGITLITKPRKNMKQYPTTSTQRYLLSQRQKIEGVFGSLKHRLLLISRVARSPQGFFMGVFSALLYYMFDDVCLKKIGFEPLIAGFIS